MCYKIQLPSIVFHFYLTVINLPPHLVVYIVLCAWTFFFNMELLFSTVNCFIISCCLGLNNRYIWILYKAKMKVLGDQTHAECLIFDLESCCLFVFLLWPLMLKKDREFFYGVLFMRMLICPYYLIPRVSTSKYYHMGVKSQHENFENLNQSIAQVLSLCF